MDRSWVKLTNKSCVQYIQGVKDFIKQASRFAPKNNRIRCPCRDCNNVYSQHINVVETHLFDKGIIKTYTNWVHHGEKFEPTMILDDDSDDDGTNEEETPTDNINEMQDFFEALHAGTFMNSTLGEVAYSQEQAETSNNHPNQQSSEKKSERFSSLLRDAQCELYPGCKKYSKLSFLIKLLHLKVINRLSNKAFDQILELYKDALPNGETLPKSYYEAKSIMRDLGLGYVAIHACKHDCVLFWKEHEDKDECPVCHEPRYISNEGEHRKIPQKVLRYFPLKPRLQRLFMSKKTATDMRWHKEKRLEEDGVLRHPADSEAWTEFDKTHNSFANDPRNVRLGLASDGFNPFGNMSNSYSIWPVIVTPYNLPPWMCMKEPYLFMSLLIPGPKSPGNDIDVYLQPLIDELKDLWEDGIETFDASTGENFQLHAALLWTINDFPAYGILSGWSTKGKLACPNCNKDTCSISLKHGRKLCYMGHRRFLPRNHAWRNSDQFDGERERRLRPKELSGNDVLYQLSRLNNVKFGKGPANTKKRKREIYELNWRKRSIFFELPYWQSLKLRHNLDVMHIEKNICESVVGTLLNIDGKTKDTVKARLDLELMGIRKELHIVHDGNSFVMPPAYYTMSAEEKRSFCEWLKLVKFPDGYASNISRCVNTKDCRLIGMKSHDCHVLLQRLLPIGIRGYLRKDICNALIELSFFFKELCCKTLQLEILERLENDIAIILCKLEKIFPPAFFDIMVHLAIHLPHEGKFGGPVHYRWMYPIERFLCTLKKYVRNKARPEGSIAEAYIDSECLTFCSMYLQGVETRFNREDRNFDGGQDKQNNISVFSTNMRPLGSKKVYEKMDMTDYSKARLYVLNNCNEIEHYINEHMAELERQSTHNVQERHDQLFPKWFENRGCSRW